jgi:cytochrome c-type biogenesis protein CcmH/NrfG
VAADQASFHDTLMKTLELRPEFAPAYVQLARMAVRQGNLSNTLAVARKAEQLEPSRAGYHLLSGQIMLRTGRGTEAGTFAKYVAERWYGPDHDEAVELWNSVPEAQRTAGDAPF